MEEASRVLRQVSGTTCWYQAVDRAKENSNCIKRGRKNGHLTGAEVRRSWAQDTHGNWLQMPRRSALRFLASSCAQWPASRHCFRTGYLWATADRAFTGRTKRLRSKGGLAARAPFQAAETTACLEVPGPAPQLR